MDTFQVYLIVHDTFYAVAIAWFLFPFSHRCFNSDLDPVLNKEGICDV